LGEAVLKRGDVGRLGCSLIRKLLQFEKRGGTVACEDREMRRRRRMGRKRRRRSSRRLVT
jgi:hypothetical protein